MNEVRVLDSFDVVVDEVRFYVFSGDSTATKPTVMGTEDKPVAICDGSIFLESDTDDSYTFNEKTGSWKKKGGEE